MTTLIERFYDFIEKDTADIDDILKDPFVNAKYEDAFVDDEEDIQEFIRNYALDIVSEAGEEGEDDLENFESSSEEETPEPSSEPETANEDDMNLFDQIEKMQTDMETAVKEKPSTDQNDNPDVDFSLEDFEKDSDDEESNEPESPTEEPNETPNEESPEDLSLDDAEKDADKTADEKEETTEEDLELLNKNIEKLDQLGSMLDAVVSKTNDPALSKIKYHIKTLLGTLTDDIEKIKKDTDVKTLNVKIQDIIDDTLKHSSSVLKKYMREKGEDE